MATRSSLKKSRVLVDDFARLRLPRALAVSPDGTLLAYTLEWCDLEKKKYFANLHVLDLETKTTRQWTRGEQSDRATVWSADGSRLAFLRNEKGQDRVFVIPREGGAPEEIFRTRGGIASVQWAQDDRALIVKYRAADPDADADKAASENKEPESKAPAVRKITRLYYKLDGDGFLPEARWQLVRLDLKTKEFTALTKGKADVECWCVAPDGWRVAYVTNVHPDPDKHPYHTGIFEINLQSGKRSQYNVPFGEKSALAISPNGRYLVYLGHHKLGGGRGVETFHPHLLDLQTGRQRNLTPRFDRQASDETLGDLGYGLGPPPLFWSADSRHVFYPVTDEGDTYLARASLRPGDPERVWPLKGQVPVFNVRGKSLALIHRDFARIADVYFCQDNTAKKLSFEKLAESTPEYFSSRNLGKTREIHFRSGDGTPLHGFLLTPPDFKPRKKYPAILEVHGGPRCQYGRVFFHEMQYLAAQGFVVFYTNPRGSQGYGREFADAITNAWGTDDFNDIMAAADFLEALPFVDGKRIGITGGSYGGYMTAYAVGRTHRFRAAVAQRGVMNLTTMQGTSDIGWHVRYELGGYHWENPEGYALMSPITYAHNIRTPLLILHNECDHRCAIEQAEQLYATVKILGKAPVEFWRFPEESHGLSRGGRPDRRIARLEGIAGWFKKWMK
ncbi:MAG: S9 family peptidase [bacterium]|nr:S9 family peptidase [bacterium]